MIKRLLPVLAVMLAFTCTLAPTDAYAKKFGGSKSFGKSFKTKQTQPSLFKSPSSQSKSTHQNNLNNAGKPQKKGLFGGMMGGLLGGLLVGGLIGSLLGGGPFSGIQFMDILIIAGLAFVLFKLFKGMNRAKASAMNGGYQNQKAAWQGAQGNSSHQESAYQQTAQESPQQSSWADNVSFRKDAGSAKDAEFSNFESSSQSTSQHQGHPNGFGPSEDDVPFNLPPNFDMNGFLNRSRDHYRTIQDAWNSGDMETIRDYVSPDLFDHLKRERAALTGDQHTEVMYVDAELVRADTMMGKTELSLKFSGRYRDNVERVEEKITDIWHLEQAREGAPWLIVGIEYSK